MFNQFLNGAIVFGFWIAALFFLRFWRSTRDRLFALFSFSFFLLGCERIVVALLTNLGEFHFSVYFIRLLAFGMIIFGIVQKNRPETK
jgi:hypothetical protein